EQKLIEEAGVSVRRFEFLPPSIDPAEFERPRLNPYLKRGIKNGKIVLTVSRLAPGKGVEEVVEAFQQIRKNVQEDTYLVIIGEDFGHKNDIEKKIHQIGLQKNIHLWGRVSREDLVAAYQHADVFVLASHYEAFGIVLIESQAAGTPVIARNTAAIPFVMPHGQSGYLFTSQAELIEHAVLLLTDADTHKKFSLFGKKFAASTFSWNNQIEKLLTIYDEFSHP
ncbi:MAG: glycosyltransferase family 4 protein, partial [Acidobacteriota bacterium]